MTTHVEVAPVGASDPVSRDGEGGSEVHEVKPSPPTEHHKNSESIRMTPSPSSEGQDLAALSERLRDLLTKAEHALSTATTADHKLAVLANYGDLALQALPSLLKEAANAKAFLGGELDAVRATLAEARKEAEGLRRQVAELEAASYRQQALFESADARAEAAEGALKELRAFADRCARDCDSPEWLRNRARALTGEGAER